jgi:hypothetical protein
LKFAPRLDSRSHVLVFSRRGYRDSTMNPCFGGDGCTSNEQSVNLVLNVRWKRTRNGKVFFS